jgi:hypothetical protein
MAKDSRIARTPAAMRIQPSIPSSMPGMSTCRTNARIAPMTMRTIPSPMYMVTPCGRVRGKVARIGDRLYL